MDLHSTSAWFDHCPSPYNSLLKSATSPSPSFQKLQQLLHPPLDFAPQLVQKFPSSSFTSSPFSLFYLSFVFWLLCHPSHHYQVCPTADCQSNLRTLTTCWTPVRYSRIASEHFTCKNLQEHLRCPWPPVWPRPNIDYCRTTILNSFLRFYWFHLSTCRWKPDLYRIYLWR